MIEQREHTEQHDHVALVLTDEDTVDELVSCGDMEQDCFQLWAMLADRSPTKTSRLAMEHFGYDLKPNRVRMWSTRHRWAERATQLFQEAAPDFYERTKMNLVGAAPAAAAYIGDVAAGRVRGDKVRVIASFGALDRVGFLPHTRREAERGQTPATSSLPGDAYEALTDEELRQAIAARVAHLRES